MTYTYPGVYIEELPSGQHTITGVATSIAAFIGWSNQGPVSEAVMVESWPEYQTLFGGMIPGIYLGYAVYQFFLNGGSQAYIVRLTWTDVLTASNTIAGLTLYANNPGTWRNNIFVLITQPTSSTTFNLQVIQTAGGQAQTLESYTNLSTAPTSPQYAVTVINSDSNYITFTSPSGSTPTSISLSTSLPVTSTVAGTVSSGFFVSYEQVIQNTTNASAYVVGAVPQQGPMTIGPVTGTPDGSDTWVGQTSGAVFTPSATPATTTTPAPVCLNGGGTTQSGTTQGNDGTQLTPSSADAGGNFETQLNGSSGYSLLGSVPIFNLL